MIRPDAVIFDMDGVVLDSEPIYRACWQRAAEELGYAVSADIYDRVVGRKDGDSERILVGEFGRSFPLEEFRARWPRYWQQHVQSQGVPLKDGVIEFLDFLEARKIRAALATSTEREKALQSLGSLRQRFEVMVSGDEVERGKPAPDIFLAAAKRIGTAPARCLVIEDAEPGVRAAHAAGMAIILIPDLREPDREVRNLATAVCRSLQEVTGLLEPTPR